MLDAVKQKVTELVSVYESERQRSAALSARLEVAERELAECRAKVGELTRQVDNLKLQGVFAADGNNILAKERLDKLIREIDKCIRCLEK